jgi:hypothetical protein
MPVGHESAFTSMGEIEQQAMLGADVVRQAGWRRLVGLLVVLMLIFPIVAAFVIVIIKLG